MKIVRYTFQMILMKGEIYALGGKTFSTYVSAEHSNLFKCEKYDFLSDSWKYIADLNIKRSTLGAFVYRDEIYVYGGYSHMRRAQEIERYDEKINKWLLISYLPFDGIDGFFCQQVSSSEVLIFGGKSD